MNEAPNDHAVLERHEGPIRNPKHLILAVLAAFIIPIFIIVLLANFVTSARKPSAGNEESLEKEAVAKRIAPIAKLEWKGACAESGRGSLQSAMRYLSCCGLGRLTEVW
jgi:hypothetical protein